MKSIGDKPAFPRALGAVGDGEGLEPEFNDAQDGMTYFEWLAGRVFAVLVATGEPGDPQRVAGRAVGLAGHLVDALDAMANGDMP